jgi:monofunctional biosynthetic peptidoglycan transglycosylase
MPSPFRRAPLVRLLRSLAILLLAWLALSWLVVLVLRFVPPWTSAMMMERQLGAWIHGEKDFRLHQHWVPWTQVSAWVPLAMVGGVDQRFPYHNGLDLVSIQDGL